MSVFFARSMRYRIQNLYLRSGIPGPEQFALKPGISPEFSMIKDEMMKEKTFTLESDYIELIKLLKLMRIAESGSHAKYLVEEKMVCLNGQVEHRKRAKVRPGDLVELADIRIRVQK